MPRDDTTNRGCPDACEGDSGASVRPDASSKRHRAASAVEGRHMEGRAETLEAVGRLAGGIAHDFNNLLTAISGYAEFALGRLDDDATDLRRDIQEIRGASERAALLTSQLLSFSGRQILRPSEVDLDELVDSLRGRLLPLLGEDVELSTVGSGTCALLVNVDRKHLEQAIVDMAVNGREAIPGGGRIAIETSSADVD